MEIRYSFVWRRDFGTTICDDNAIGSLSSGYSNGAWDMHGVLSYLPANETTAIICTAYDAQENWTYGHNSFITTVTVSGPFHVRYVEIYCICQHSRCLLWVLAEVMSLTALTC